MTQKTEGVYVEILGHKARIKGIYGRVGDGIPHKEDHLCVYLEFDEAVDSTLGFAFGLPAKSYGKDEFLAVVVEEGGKALSRILERGRGEREERRVKEQRQERVDSIAADIKSTIGFEEAER